MTRTLRALALSLLAVTLAAAAADVDPQTQLRQEFLAAYALAQASQPDAPAGDSDELRRYALYPYLLAARLQRDLRKTSGGEAADVDARVADFESRYGDEPVGRELRRSWLPELARRQAWTLFLAQYSDAQADTAQRCDELDARIALQQTETLDPAITAQWLNGHDTPAECEPAFDWLRTHKLLAPSLVDQRARLALAAGNIKLADSLVGGLPPDVAAPLREWLALVQQPEREIDRLIAEPNRPVEAAALADAWWRLARANPDSALARYQPLLSARHMDAVAASQYARSLALALAWSRRPEASDYFARVAPADLDERTREWMGRAAAWAGDWGRLAQVIAAMPQAMHDQPRWRYWAARATEKLGDAPGARAAYAQLTASDNYYAVMASARIEQPYAPHPQALVLDDAGASRLARLPGMVRAHELLLCDFEPLANAEWAAQLDSLDPQQRTDAIALARRWAWYPQVVTGAAHQAAFNDYELLFPLAYEDAVRAAAAMTSLPEDLIYGILRTESLYDTYVVSHAGAIGLMQLLPETAETTARHWQRQVPSKKDLTDPNVNVPLGSAQLREMLDHFGEQIPVAIAAYNAGPNAAARWLPDQPRDGDVWIENIPYNETRDYVQRVLWHAVVYAWKRSGAPQAAGALLAPVANLPPVVAPQVAPTPAPPAAAPAPAPVPPGK